MYINFIYREETGRSIDLKANVAGQKETVLRNRENGMARVVLEKSLVAGLAVVLWWKVIGDVIAVKRTKVGANGVSTRIILYIYFDFVTVHYITKQL